MPDTATVMALRQKVDVYQWKGIPVARAWPVVHGPRVKSAAELATNAKMSAVAQITGGVDESTRAAYKGMMHSAQGVTWVDFFRNVAMNGSGWLVG